MAISLEDKLFLLWIYGSVLGIMLFLQFVKIDFAMWSLGLILAIIGATAIGFFTEEE